MHFFDEEGDNKVIRKMAEDTGLKNAQQVIDNALAFFQWAIEETDKGHLIARVNESQETFQVLITPPLEHVIASKNASATHAAPLEKEGETKLALKNFGLGTGSDIARKMMSATGLKNCDELINNALTVFGWAIEETDKGHLIAAVNEQEMTFREFIMPALQHVSATKEQRREDRVARSYVDRLDREYKNSSLARAIADLDPDNDKYKGGHTH